MMVEKVTEDRPFESADLRQDRPTEVVIGALGHWVIWQFPRQKEGGLCAAVHPPTVDYGWLPAIVALNKTTVQIHAHATAPFPTPEAAAKWMEER